MRSIAAIRPPITVKAATMVRPSGSRTMEPAPPFTITGRANRANAGPRERSSEATACAPTTGGRASGPEPPPSARLIPGFGDYALEFTLTCQVASFVDQFTVQHELRKRLLKRLRAERIRIPLPTEVRPV